MSLTEETEARGVHPSAPRAMLVAFYLFVISIPLDNLGVKPLGMTVSIPQIVGTLFLAVGMVYARYWLRAPSVVFWCFLFYLAVVLLNVFRLDEYHYPYVQRRLGQLLQQFGFFLIASQLFKSPKVVRQAVYYFAIAMVVVGVAFFLRLPGVFSVMGADEYARYTALGYDPNGLACASGVAVVALLWLGFEDFERKRGVRYRYLGMMLIPLALVVRTGSRGGAIALIAGTVVFLWGKSLIRKLRWKVALTLLCAGLVGFVSLDTPEFYDRWAKAVEGRQFAGRELIFPGAWEMFLERPLDGWGPGEHLYVLGRRLDVGMVDTHNLLLWVGTEVGLLGLAPVVVALLLLAQMAWKSRRGTLASLPMMLFVLIFVANMSLTLLYNKLTWLVFAIVAGIGVARREFARRRVAAPPRREEGASVGTGALVDLGR